MFVISGPSTNTAKIGKADGGQPYGAGVPFSYASRCATDTFAVTGAPSVPVLCGALTGEHGKILKNQVYIHHYTFWNVQFQFTLTSKKNATP